LPSTEAPLLDSQLQNRNKYASLYLTFSVDILRTSTLGKPYGIKCRCYWEHLGECIKEHFSNLGILWGLDGNTLRTREKKPKKKNSPHPTPPHLTFKRKKTEPIMSAC